MKTFCQIRSSFNDPEDKMFSCQFETMLDLLMHKFIYQHMDYRDFFRFSITKDNTLMAEYRNGFEWWVVGYIDDSSNLNLPLWIPKYRAILEGKEIILTNEVISSCGDILTLKDGRKALRLALRTASNPE